MKAKGFGLGTSPYNPVNYPVYGSVRCINP